MGNDLTKIRYDHSDQFAVWEISCIESLKNAKGTMTILIFGLAGQILII